MSVAATSVLMLGFLGACLSTTSSGLATAPKTAATALTATVVYSGRAYVPVLSKNGVTPAPTLTATPMPTQSVTATATSTPMPASTGTPTLTRSLKDAKSWVYQLYGYQNDQLEQIRRNAFDMAVVDLARDAGSDYFTRTEIGALQASGKIVLAYFVIGSIEDYRPELALVEQTMPDIILGRVDGWPQERYVKYWDERWWAVVQGRIDQALQAGYNGAYLDLIFAYEDINPASVGKTRRQLAEEMVKLIARVSTYAKSKRSDFLIVPQNNPELYTLYDKPLGWNLYLNAIDGLAVENLYYLDSGGPCSAGWCQENIDNSQAVLAAGKPVFSADYSNVTANIRDAYTRARAAGFVPYVSEAGLPACYQYDVAPLTACN